MIGGTKTDGPARSATLISRRRFVQGVVAGGLAAAFDILRSPIPARAQSFPQHALSGTQFNLAVRETPVNFTGRTAYATAVNGIVPGPILRWREGDTVTISVANHLRSPSSIHWHGIRLPSNMDGVPGLDFAGIAPGGTYVYRFPVKQHGTYWYHSHSGFEEQTGLYGALIIDPKGPDPIRFDREYAIVLSDWTNENPDTVYSNLKQESDYYNYHQRTVGTFIEDVRKHGLAATVSERLTWGRSNMSPTDISDVSGATYTYLLNGHPPASNWTAIFKPGERVRLRFINASSMTYFDVRIPGLPMTVVQADGNDVEPVAVDEFRIAVAETYDVIVQPASASAYTIFAQSEDRTGYARATLAARPGMTAAVPPMDPRPMLTMVDMAMVPMGQMGQMGQMHGGGSTGESAMEMEMPPAKGREPMGAMHPHAHSAIETRRTTAIEMPHGVAPSLAEQFAKRERMVGPLAPGQPNARTQREFPGPDMGRTSAPLVAPAALHLGPEVNSIAQYPTQRLSTPGPGLRDNGRRVLTYADLRAVHSGDDPRPPDREIELHLTGNMERFIWGFDGRKFSEAEPIRMKLGERLRIILINDTMMSHPIHLHGLWSELENDNGAHRPYKHTINVKPGERLSYLVSADVPGRWAYHCHLSYHMEAGMFREVIVS